MAENERWTVINPYDQSEVERFKYDRPDELDAKVNASVRAQRQWSQVSLADRCEQIGQAVERFSARRQQVALDVSRQMGKPLAQALGEFDTFLKRIDQMLVDAPHALAADLLPIQDRLTRSIEHVPLGVVLNIAAWNYPLLVSVNVLVPALLAGNSVLLKHSQRTPLTGLALAECFAELDVPDLVLALFTNHRATLGLVGDARVDHVAFTGSVDGGRRVRQAAADRFVEMGLELGGKDPAYVAADADLEFAAANVVDGACYNAGQSCCAIERVYVHRDVYDDFMELALTHVEAYRCGDPLDEQTTMGPLARRPALDELETQIRDAAQRGAKVVSGGGRLPEATGNFFLPTLLAEAPQESLVMQEESFGPLVPVCAVDSDDQAVERMNDSRFGLTASVWTSDRQRAASMAQRIRAGTVFQNRADYVDPAQPWTGWGESGLGSTLSRYGFYALTRRKSLHFRE